MTILKKVVKQKNGDITFHDEFGNEFYYITSDRIGEQDWLQHMSTKTWMTEDALMQCAEFGVGGDLEKALKLMSEIR